jgi:hypothetical protein
MPPASHIYWCVAPDGSCAVHKRSASLLLCRRLRGSRSVAIAAFRTIQRSISFVHEAGRVDPSGGLWLEDGDADEDATGRHRDVAVRGDIPRRPQR